MGLDGRVALVTGGNRGIGAAIAGERVATDLPGSHGAHHTASAARPVPTVSATRGRRRGIPTTPVARPASRRCHTRCRSSADGSSA